MPSQLNFAGMVAPSTKRVDVTVVLALPMELLELVLEVLLQRKAQPNQS